MITQATMRRNILLHLDAARDNPLWELGAHWYVREAESLGTRNEIRPSLVVALLSPQLSWKRNKYAAQALMNGNPKPAGVLSRSWYQALNAWASGQHEFGPRARKTHAFAQLLFNPFDPVQVCLDVWALRCVGLPKDFRLTPTLYHYVSQAYRHVAFQAGLRPSQVQAISWCAIRGRAQ